jgi:hypothetical protein
MPEIGAIQAFLDPYEKSSRPSLLDHLKERGGEGGQQMLHQIPSGPACLE